jgi:hypothetical protein
MKKILITILPKLLLSSLLTLAPLTFACAQAAVSATIQCSSELGAALEHSVDTVDNLGSKFVASMEGISPGLAAGSKPAGFNVVSANGANYFVSLPLQATSATTEDSLYCGKTYFQGVPLFYQVKIYKDSSHQSRVRLSEQSSLYECDSRVVFSDSSNHKAPNGIAPIEAALRVQIQEVASAMGQSLSNLTSAHADPKNWLYKEKLKTLPKYLEALATCQKNLAGNGPMQRTLEHELRKMKLILEETKPSLMQADSKSVLGEIVNEMDRQVKLQIDHAPDGISSHAALGADSK